MFLGICLAQERRSQRHFRSSFGGQELRACVGLKEADCCTPLLFLGCDHDSHMLDRWQEVVSDLWPGLWVGVMKPSFRDLLRTPVPQAKSIGYQNRGESCML